MTGSASSDQADPDKARSLFRGKLWFWGPIAPLVALDLWSKSAAFSFLERHAPLSIPEEGRFYDVIDGSNYYMILYYIILYYIIILYSVRLRARQCLGFAQTRRHWSPKRTQEHGIGVFVP